MQRTPELANNFIFIHCRSHPFNLIHWRNALRRLSARARVAHLNCIAGDANYSALALPRRVGSRKPTTKERAILYRCPFPFLAHSFARLAPARPHARSPPYRVAIRTRHDQHSDETRTRSWNNGTVVSLVKHSEGAGGSGANSDPRNCPHARSKRARRVEKGSLHNCRENRRVSRADAIYRTIH